MGCACDAVVSGRLDCCADIVVQKDSRSVSSVYDAVAIALFHAAVESGQYARCAIDMCDSPDSDGSGRNARQVTDLPAPFVGRVIVDRGRGADADGFIEWTDPVEFEVLANGAPSYVMLPPRRIPLEIGDTTGSRTLLHMAEDRALARWPYGSDLVHLFVRV